jgi:hypothetical protein
MTDNNPTADDVLEQFRNHPDAPAIADTDELLYHDSRVYIIHGPGEVTRVSVTLTDEHGLRIAGVVWITTERPRITPADDVIAVGRITHIIHGPGRETRVLP